MTNIIPLSDADFSLFQKLLIEECGLYFEKDRGQRMCEALSERWQDLGHNSPQEYYNFLKFHPSGRLELRKLLDLITVGETYFFRNTPHFTALMEIVLPEIINRKQKSQDKSIRIWSAGCSAGDEPYSIAIAIMELLPDYPNWDISILGTDINRNALSQAKTASYNSRDIHQVHAGFLSKYFDKKGGSFFLKEKVKKLVTFEYHNLAKDPFTLHEMDGLDIIFCRNVTIYFNFETTKRIVEKFYDCLGMNGYFFIGHSETLWQMTNKFETINLPQTFIYKKTGVPQEEEVPFIAFPSFARQTPLPGDGQFEIPKTDTAANDIPLPQEIRPAAIFEEQRTPFDNKWYDEVLEVLDAHLLHNSTDINCRLSRATILANQEKYQEAIDELIKIVEMNSLFEAAHFFLGVLLIRIKDFKQAEDRFRKVLYIDPSIELAYFNLGKLYAFQGNHDKAGKEFKQAIKLLEKKANDEEIRFSEAFTVDLLLRACEGSLQISRTKGGIQ